MSVAEFGGKCFRAYGVFVSPCETFISDFIHPLKLIMALLYFLINIRKLLNIGKRGMLISMSCLIRDTSQKLV